MHHVTVNITTIDTRMSTIKISDFDFDLNQFVPGRGLRNFALFYSAVEKRCNKTKIF